ncbi:MAG: hypothetical protein K2P22_08225 [Lachnospiraceae bacterium]|nr:hypothetical protein [Lachnospiraceae bacterium]
MNSTIVDELSDDLVGGLALGGLLGIGVGVIAVFVITWYVFQVVAYWKIFNKFGEPGWKAIIPVYNVYVLYKATWSVKMFVVSIILAALTGLRTVGVGTAVEAVFPMIASIAAFALALLDSICKYYLAKAFGRGTGFAVGLLLMGPIFKLILGFGSSEYIGNTTALKAGSN